MTRSAVFILGVCAAVASAEVDWPRFRGPNGSGVAAGDPPIEFGPDRNVVWATVVPLGKSSPVLTEDRVYLTAHEDGRLLTLCLDRRTGEILWRREAPARRVEKMHQLNDEAASSPVTDGVNVYVFFGGFGLLSYAPDGRERWRVPLGPFSNFHGMGASPVFADGKVFMVCDQDQGAYLVAVDAADGSVAWRRERPEMVHSFSTPAIYRPADGPTELVVPGSYQMVSYDAATGDELWRLRGLTYQVKSSPTIAGDRLYFNGWAPGGEPAVRLVLPTFPEALAKLDADGDGRLSKAEIPTEWMPANWDMQDLDKDGVFDERDWKYYSRRRTSTNSTLAVRLGGRGDVTVARTLWRYDKSLPDVASVLLYRGLLYLIRNGGILTTLDPESGEARFVGRVREAIDDYYASPVAAAGRVYLSSMRGMISVLAAGPEPETLTVNKLGEDVFATPALADGRLYVRTQTKLYCFGRSFDSRREAR